MAFKSATASRSPINCAAKAGCKQGIFGGLQAVGSQFPDQGLNSGPQQ